MPLSVPMAPVVGSVTNRRKQKIVTYKWAIENPAAVILMLHGIGDYTTGVDNHEEPPTGSFQAMANEFNSRGYTVYSLDFHGHGDSEGTRCLIEDFDHLVDEAVLVVDVIEKELPDKSVFVLGESMGGAVTLQTSLKISDRIAGIMLLAPMIKIDPALYPPASFIVVPLLKVLANFIPAAKIVPGESDRLLERCTRNKQVLASCKTDEKRYVGTQRMATAVQMLNTTELICKSLPQYMAPVLVMHGTDDMVTSLEYSKMFMDKAGATDKTLKTYEGAYHMLMVEVFDQVTKDIDEWINARI